MADNANYNSEEVNAKLKTMKAVVIGDTFFFGKGLPGNVSDALQAEGAIKMRQVGSSMYPMLTAIGDSDAPPNSYYAMGWQVDPDIVKSKFPGIDVFENGQVKDTKALLAERELLSPNRGLRV